MGNTFDAIVIGAGHNGLTAAAYLAGGGLRTLVLERRALVGGCAVTEEIDAQAAPGCRVSTASYIASMLRPEVIRDLRLAEHGLRMVACEPGVQVALPDGRVLSWWSDRERLAKELDAIAPRDRVAFFELDEELRRLARYLQPFFLRAPPDPERRGLGRWLELWRSGRAFRGIPGRDVAALTRFLTGSLADLLESRFHSDAVRRLVLANSLYGQHGGPRQPGTAMGLLFHLLSGGEDERQGFAGHVIGGMGAITRAMETECRARGVELRFDSEVTRIAQRSGRVAGVELGDGSTLEASLVVSNADPKRTFLELCDPRDLPPAFVRDVRGIRMDGPCGKVNFVLDAEPRVRGMPATHTPAERSLFTLAPSLDEADACYQDARRGLLSERLWVDCVLASNVDPSLVREGRHVLTTFVQYLPYRLADGSWDERREDLGERVTAIIERYAPGFAKSVVARRVLSPADLEATFGITEGNIFHGDIALPQLAYMRPVPGWAQYRTPVEGLYLCGAGTHPGGGVTGAPGYNAAKRILRDWSRG
mgnify:CR=1 FL=1